MELKITNKKGEVFTVLYDECDHELISKYKWHITTRGYVASINVIARDKPITMHRFLMNADKNQIVDHKNQIKTDNRRSNLRFCTRSQNAANGKKCRGGGKYKGVYNYQGRGILSKIILNRKTIHIGYFKTEEEAARAYDTAAKIYHGEFACLNFPDE